VVAQRDSHPLVVSSLCPSLCENVSMMGIGYDQLPEQLLRRAHLLHVPVDLTALTAQLSIRLVSRSDLPPKSAESSTVARCGMSSW
jgi:hypothetical protein